MSDETDRIVNVPGVSNFRDCGGYPTADGGSVRRGRLFRGAHVGRVSADGAAHFQRLGIGTIIDLRGVDERASALPAFADGLGISVVSTPIEPGSTLALRQLLEEGAPSPEAVRNIMIATYRRFAKEAAPAMGVALTAIGEAIDRPVVVHCTAGKDRTGFIVAMILSVLGVPRETIVADYLITNTAWDRHYNAASRGVLSSAALARLLLADADYLDAAFEAVEAQHGSVRDYVGSVTGDPRLADRLTQQLLVSRF